MNHNIFELDMIIHNKKYPIIYSSVSIILLIVLLSIYILFICDYHSYYKGSGIINNNLLEVSNINVILEKDTIEINKIKYKYQISHIDNNHEKIYLNIDNLNYIENQVLEFKIEKKSQKIIYHILDYLERR